jgi:seryl-tRNA synthetase
MIDIKALERSEINPTTQMTYADEYRKSLRARGEDSHLVDQLLEKNARRKILITEAESKKAEQNKVGEEIARLKRTKEDASELLAQMQEVAVKAKELDARAAEIDQEIVQFALRLPNKLNAHVPHGESAEDNQVVKTVGIKKSFSFSAKEHWELGEKLKILDFERATKTTGARFTFLRGAASKIERALIQFMMDVHSEEHGYEEMIPPFIVNSNSLKGTGQFPKFQEDVFHIANTDLHLIPTAEVPVTNYYADEILKESELPVRFVAYSPCFRSEAGSYGKDTRGLIRQHQFNKVELVIFAHPEKSYELHDQLTGHAEKILERLELPYRTMNLCSKDIGFGAAKCHDIEVWLPGQNSYREISSCSNYEDFQARRANIRFRGEGAKAKPQFVHTINGSGLAVGRTLIAVLENYQQEDGSIVLPKALLPYLGGLEKIQAPGKN